MHNSVHLFVYAFCSLFVDSTNMVNKYEYTYIHTYIHIKYYIEKLHTVYLHLYKPVL